MDGGTDQGETGEEARLDILSRRCPLEWGFWCSCSEMPQSLVSEYFLFHIGFPVLHLFLVVSLLVFSVRWPEYFSSQPSYPFSTQSVQLPSEQKCLPGIPREQRLVKDLHFWVQAFPYTLISSAFPLSKHILSLRMREGGDRAIWSRIGLTLAYVGLGSARLKILWYFLGNSWLPELTES